MIKIELKIYFKFINIFYETAGLLIAGGKGVVRSMYIDQKSYGDFLPCDIAINGVFVCTWNFLEFK
jgi:hypothetical protein